MEKGTFRALSFRRMFKKGSNIENIPLDFVHRDFTLKTIPLDKKKSAKILTILGVNIVIMIIVSSLITYVL